MVGRRAFKTAHGESATSPPSSAQSRGAIFVAMPARRFPPPWTVKEQDARFVVIDHSGQKLAYIYFEGEPGRRSAAKQLTKDEARRIAANIAKLSGLVRKRYTRGGGGLGALKIFSDAIEQQPKLRELTLGVGDTRPWIAR
jgi:hypothetical protein